MQVRLGLERRHLALLGRRLLSAWSWMMLSMPSRQVGADVRLHNLDALGELHQVDGACLRLASMGRITFSVAEQLLRLGRLERTVRAS